MARTRRQNEHSVKAALYDARGYDKEIPYSAIAYWTDRLEDLLLQAYKAGEAKGKKASQKA